jgi:hypothetical protein
MDHPDASDNDQSRPAGRYDIRLLFRHPTIDPDLITSTLGIEPSMQRRAGDRVIGIDGKVRRSIEERSVWSVWVAYEAEEDSHELVMRLQERLAMFLQPLSRHASFVRQLSAEGEALIELNILGHFHFPCEIPVTTLRTITELGLDLGFEVFPDSVP